MNKYIRVIEKDVATKRLLHDANSHCATLVNIKKDLDNLAEVALLVCEM